MYELGTDTKPHFHLPCFYCSFPHFNESRYANRLIAQVGLGLALYDLLTCAEGKIRWGDGLVWYKGGFASHRERRAEAGCGGEEGGEEGASAGDGACFYIISIPSFFILPVFVFRRFGYR